MKVQIEKKYTIQNCRLCGLYSLIHVVVEVVLVVQVHSIRFVQ